MSFVHLCYAEPVCSAVQRCLVDGATDTPQAVPCQPLFAQILPPSGNSWCKKPRFAVQSASMTKKTNPQVSVPAPSNAVESSSADPISWTELDPAAQREAEKYD